jgi:1-deoxy-D-xylulose-5-phosphate reductoisomerase
MSNILRVAILGSTGSIGRQALDVVARAPDRVRVVALAAASDHRALTSQATEFRPVAVALADADAASIAAAELPGTDVGSGPAAVEALASHPEVDLVLNALVGAAGLRATVAALASGKQLALANKESLVVGGELVTALAKPGSILPVDSEHSAVFQCLLGEDARDVARIWLTASGGPFRGRDRAYLAGVGVAEALAHPTWAMGPKITIDSATLMNKGLEAIEAHHLFAIDYDHISVVVHPQSCVHSMVEFSDGSVKAHLGATDMRIPIQYAFSYPRRWSSPVEPVDFTTVGSLDFEPPDLDTFRCLALALAAGREGGTLPAVMNAANEVAVAAFLAGECTLVDIDRVVETVMSAHDNGRLESVEHVEAVDRWARSVARDAL